MVNPEVVASRLAKLREYLGYLRILKRYSYREFASDPFVRGSVERYLHLAIECCLDLGNHLIADRGLRRAQDYKEVFLILGEAKLLPQAFAKRIAPMGGFRNILVHDYLKVDPRKIYEALQDRLPDFEQFARRMAKFLRS
ncbi:MAG: DUF86 domain-containing protein [Candidatus Omnitrophica bacterium]|nr:DUF86 domain-containing protein [Candidatus Omnitrophota bacterium]